MTQIQLYSTLTRTKAPFTPIDPKQVRMYVCGPTVYDFAHIGNARPVIVFDVLFRLLQHVYGETHVLYARNITDVDDKINARAAEQGISIRELTEQTAAQFHKDMSDLNALPPTFEPRATEHIEHMIEMIQLLISKGFAYAAQGHVLFDVNAYKNYGKLSNRSLDEMISGARVEIAPYKRDPMDFVLWKPSTHCHRERSEGSPVIGAQAAGDPSPAVQDDNLVGWPSPWGFGRPGWHIECSAMAKAYLGDVFDIHAGGLDLIFPHHENEIAQSCCANGTHEFARYWLHNGFLQVEGEKMSKSLGNFFTVRQLLDQYPAEAIRLCMLMTHYRQPLNWTEKSVREAMATIENWYAAIGDVPPAGALPQSIMDAVSDDLNTPKAIAELHVLKNAAAKGNIEAKAALKAGANMLGLLLGDLESYRAFTPIGQADGAVDRDNIQALVDARTQARRNKNWPEADRLRAELAALHVEMTDHPDGTVTWQIKR